MNKTPVRFIYLLALLSLLSYTAPVNAGPDCSGDALISETFANGARWEMCWESRIRENLIINDVYYTPPNGSEKKILGSARLSQLHVAYDDSDVTYNDITQYGLGGGYLLELTEADCPLGTLLEVQTRPAICKVRSVGNDNYRTPNRSVSAESLKLFSVSQVGSYAYIVTWKFYSDGAMEPEVGATGALQRSTDKTILPFGRVLSSSDDSLWLSHTHNYYWRLDFDIGDSETDDVVTESQVRLNQLGQRKTFIERFNREQSRVIGTEHPVSWEIWEKLDNNLPGADDIGYRIEPVRYGHRLVREEKEPYTAYDFFVTVVNECERFASQNARFNPDCLNEVTQYDDGQSLIDKDITLWHRVSFHHVPRNEDQRHMHTHWDGFMIEPINLHLSTIGIDIAANSAPTLAHVNNKTTAIGSTVRVQLSANDNNNDSLSYRAQGLPDGLLINNTGEILGTPTKEGSFEVTVYVTDDIETVAREFTWTISSTPQAGSNKNDGWFGSASPALLFVCFAALTVRLRRRISVAD